jgi:hypothetical protein
MKFNICLLQPKGYIHSLALKEAAEYVYFKIKKIGYPSVISKNKTYEGDINIIFGAHINIEPVNYYPSKTVIFNTEQLPEEGGWISKEYKNLLNNNYVWDYSIINLNKIKGKNKGHLVFGYEDNLKRIQKQDKEFDLLFYGSLNDRRVKLINDLRAEGIEVKTLFGIYDDERDSYLAKSKAILNLHYYESQIFQQIRIFYPLINNIPVISEDYSSEKIGADYKEFVFHPAGGDFVQYVKNLFKDRSLFRDLSEDKLNKFSEFNNDKEIKLLLESTLKFFENRPKLADKDYSIINIGSGFCSEFGCLNINSNKEFKSDLKIDLSLKLALPSEFESENSGRILLKKNKFEKIIVNDVLQHVNNLSQFMTNCLSLLKDDGVIEINIPYDLSLDAWQDPKNIRAFNEKSWLVYTDNFWNLGWYENKFEIMKLDFLPSDFGKNLMQEKSVDEILRTPRAINSMNVVLKKRKTTSEERMIALSYTNKIATDEI